MALTEKIKKQIIEAVKKEPLSIQEISRIINKSWITTEKYVIDIAKTTGLIKIKIFRKNSKGSLKLAFYNYGLSNNNLKDKLFNKIVIGRDKEDFDFLDIFQFIPNNKKSTFTEVYKNKSGYYKAYISTALERAQESFLYFSGNLSFLSIQENNKPISYFIEKALERGVIIKIITRVNISSLKNIEKIESLFLKYGNNLEIRHNYQPLRGFIVDNDYARFKNEEVVARYKEGELDKNIRIFFEIFDEDWIIWLREVFWQIFNSGSDYNLRRAELNNILNKIKIK
jgi:hypothetical protein